MVVISKFFYISPVLLLCSCVESAKCREKKEVGGQTLDRQSKNEDRTEIPEVVCAGDVLETVLLLR